MLDAMGEVPAAAGFEAWRAAYEAAGRVTPTSRPCRGCRSTRSTGPTASRRPRWVARAVPLHPGALRLDVPRRSCGPCASSPASARPRTPTGGSRSCCAPAATACPTAFDMPTLLGRDSDDPMCEGEVGRGGVAVDTLADIEDLFAGHRPRRDHHVDDDQLAGRDVLRHVRGGGRAGRAPSGGASAGTLQNDILKEYQAQKEYVFPPRPSVRLVTDIMRFTAAEMPRWHPVSVSGYHIREAGSTAAQELAFTLANGFAYVEAALAAGLGVDEFAPRLSLLLQRPHRLLRGDRQVPGGPAHLGPVDARPLRGDRRPVDAAALPHPDRGGLAHRPAARGQHRARRHRGAGRRARRHPEPAHRLLRRGAGPAHRAGGAPGAAHPAGHRRGDRRGPRGRPARRLVVRRGADRRARAPGRGGLRPPRRARGGLDARGVFAGIEDDWFQGEIADAAYRFQRTCRPTAWSSSG